tara:strand:+ start:949 stop:1362 length:414 start_codon:yes stop_codon:yes gene_type:complete
VVFLPVSENYQSLGGEKKDPDKGEFMDLSKALVKVVKKMKVQFMLNDKPISLDEVFADTGLLPALSRRADQLSSLCLGYGLGASFNEETSSLLGVKVVFDELTPNILRLFCITDVLFEIIKASSSKTVVSLDELMYD